MGQAAEDRTLKTYLSAPGYGPGKGFGDHTVVFKDGPVMIGDKEVQEMPLTEFRDLLAGRPEELVRYSATEREELGTVFGSAGFAKGLAAIGIKPNATLIQEPGREVSLADLLVDDVTIATTGVGAER